MEKVDFLLRQVDTTLAWYKQSEDKAKFLVTINTAVSGIASSLVFVSADKAQAAGKLLTGQVGALLLVLGASLLLSFMCILRVLWARHSRLDSSLPDIRRLWFFGDVADMTSKRHAKAVGELTEQSLPSHLEAMLTSQSYIFSTNVLRKHQALNWAIVFTIVAVGSLFVLGVAYANAIS
jgi:Pycsar effector protein